MKKLILMILCAAMALSLAGCKKAEEEVETEPEPAVTVTEPEKTEEPEKQPETEPEKPAETRPQPKQEEVDLTAPLPTGKSTEEVDILPQLDIIADNIDLWRMEEYEGELNRYAITDLDQNGRLEIIASNAAGSGLYTWSSFYEVNETRDGLTELATNFGEGESQPDMIIDEAVCYYQDGVYYYIVSDTLRNGFAENYFILTSLALKDGTIERTWLGTRSMIYDPTEESEKEEAEEPEPTITYMDGNYEEITEEAFFDTDRLFPAAEKRTAHFGWAEITEDSDVSAVLRNSYDTFSVSEGN